MSEIAAMIAETERWRLEHKAAGRVIDAAACAIRLAALRQALKAVEDRG